MSQIFLRRVIWDTITIAAIGGIIYGSIGYLEAAGLWKALVMIPLMLVLGFLAVEVIYPLWYRD